jgi:hypothetical protein
MLVRRSRMDSHMSTSPAPAPALAAPRKHEVVVVSHSSLFYWWPVWAVGYLMALITVLHKEEMVTVPEGTTHAAQAAGTVEYVKDPPKDQKAAAAKTAELATLEIKKQDILVAPASSPAIKNPAFLQMTPSKNLGVIYAIVLLLVITITNVPLRGLWSVIVIIVIILTAVIFALLDVWELIFAALSFLDIRINLGGYLFISTALLIIWLVVFFLFDRQIYMIFTPGNLRVQLEIGDGETTYDTTGMTVQKQRSDLFRHWILGLGSGDLIVTTTGAQTHHFDLPNVLALGRRVREIEELLRTKQVVVAPPGK